MSGVFLHKSEEESSLDRAARSTPLVFLNVTVFLVTLGVSRFNKQVTFRDRICDSQIQALS